MKYKYILSFKGWKYFILSLLLCRLSNDYFNKFKTDCLLPTHKSFSFDSKLMIMIKAFHNSTTYDVGKPRYWKHKWLKRNVSFLNNSWCWPHFLCQYDISFESLFRLWMNQFFHFQIRINLVHTTIFRIFDSECIKLIMNLNDFFVQTM